MSMLQNLPLEIIFNIISYVDAKDLVSIVRLNRWWAIRFYDMSRKLVLDTLERGWIVRNTLETMDDVGDSESTATVCGISLVTVLDHVEPLTLNLIFNLHEIALDGFTILPQHPENPPCVNLKYNGQNSVSVQLTFIGRNTSSNRITWIEQLDPVDCILDTSKVSEEHTESSPWNSNMRVSTSPEVFVTYSLISTSADPTSQTAQAVLDTHGQREISEEDAPYLLRLDKLVCSYKWWISKVEEAESEAKRSVANDMNIW
ncbi:hypothetical protein K450DRAFT_227681 [Umbelopsis ramanniana AG]|uniref:F-box domain-containing protein n=1 Tax=Umbelopsis ramanniana AG TaxID=1314678 RepID=A0AAD5EG17_UMBRA|nr:uncharacterized protein K450DRAFT_227681 [Umbelopsis ramanniana AG]KAI8582544.1 hypothetical protein K450DRAFT_227681 [Umbelopsis ramanniana AG]